MLRSVRELASVRGAGRLGARVDGLRLFQGDKLGSAADNAYRRLLQDAFLPRLALRMENLLRRDARESTELALRIAQGIPDAAHAGAVRPDRAHRVHHLRLAGRPAARDDRGAAAGARVPSRGAARERPAVSPLRPDQQLIAATRESIARTPIAQRIYSRLKLQGVGANFPEFTIAKAAGPSATLVFARASGQPLTRGVPGLFTYDGYYKGFVKESERVTAQLAAEEGWVLGMQEKDRGRLADVQGSARVLEDVRRLYLEDYARTWETFIGDIRVVRAGGHAGSIQLARLLSATIRRCRCSCARS